MAWQKSFGCSAWEGSVNSRPTVKRATPRRNSGGFRGDPGGWREERADVTSRSPGFTAIPMSPAEEGVCGAILPGIIPAPAPSFDERDDRPREKCARYGGYVGTPGSQPQTAG